MQKRPFDGSIHFATRGFHRVAHIYSNLQDPVERTDRYYLIRFPRFSDGIVTLTHHKLRQPQDIDS